jgi:HEAT repeat protein
VQVQAPVATDAIISPADRLRGNVGAVTDHEVWGWLPPFYPVAKLLSGLNHCNASVRALAAWQLGCWGRRAQQAVPALVDALDDADLQTCAAALVALTWIAPESKTTAVALVNMLGHEEDRISNVAAGLLAKLGPAAVPALLQGLQRRSHRVAVRSAEVLGRIGAEAEPAVLDLADAIEDANPFMRQQAAIALGQIGPDAEASVPDLRHALYDPQGPVREAAWWALGEIDPTARPTRPPHHPWRLQGTLITLLLKAIAVLVALIFFVVVILILTAPAPQSFNTLPGKITAPPDAAPPNR